MRTFAFKIDPMTGEEYYEVYARGRQLLNDPHLNKGSAFTHEEREALGLEGLLRSTILPLDVQTSSAYEAFQRKPDDLEKYIFLVALQDRSEVVFYRLVADHLKEMVPIVYTPTVGTACLQMSHIQRRFRGVYITPREHRAHRPGLREHHPAPGEPDRGHRRRAHPGSGRSGFGWHGHPRGQGEPLCGRGRPAPACVPARVPGRGHQQPAAPGRSAYLGYRHPRLRGEPYEKLVETFVLAVKRHFPDALLQWEDFGKSTAFKNLERYRDRILSFNDDIQGTGTTALAALMTAMRIKQSRFQDERYLIVGMGQAGTGIALNILAALAEEGLSAEEARSRIFAVDVQGLLLEDDPALEAPQRPMAQRPSTVAAWDLESPRPDQHAGRGPQCPSHGADRRHRPDRTLQRSHPPGSGQVHGAPHRVRPVQPHLQVRDHA